MPSLLELRQVTQADVYKGGVLAATLTRSGRHIAFSYLDEYRSVGGPPVASTLPIGTDPVIQPAGALPPFFSGLLPEGRRLTALRQAVKTSADDYAPLEAMWLGVFNGTTWELQGSVIEKK